MIDIISEYILTVKERKLVYSVDLVLKSEKYMKRKRKWDCFAVQ
jgi:hypothetical protein